MDTRFKVLQHLLQYFIFINYNIKSTTNIADLLAELVGPQGTGKKI
jgi:hypothetical protein